jgi:hypothetical protein
MTLQLTREEYWVELTLTGYVNSADARSVALPQKSIN